MIAVIVEWTVCVGVDRRTGDPEVNRSIRNRMMAPVEIPGVALLIIAFVILGLSRAFLAPGRSARTAAAITIASLILIGAVIVAVRLRAPPRRPCSSSSEGWASSPAGSQAQ